jgi:hypothetical protein
MSRSTQLRFVATVLFAVTGASLIATSAHAFSSGNGGTIGGGNETFADPDEQIGKMFGLDKAGEPSSLGSPAQVDLKSNPYKHFHFDSIATPPDPLARPRN